MDHIDMIGTLLQEVFKYLSFGTALHSVRVSEISSCPLLFHSCQIKD